MLINGKKIFRVFPRRTNATPNDDYVRIGFPDLFDVECDEVHISVTFDYDLEMARLLEGAWLDYGYNVSIGGPALDDNGSDFVPGLYLKKGYVITSRGCPNKCWFCKVWKREGGIRELPITEGWNVLDSNLLACSESHIVAVFDMLSQQERRPEFTGGLDPEFITLDIAQELKRIKTRRLYMAYDTEDDYPNLVEAAYFLKKAGFTVRGHTMMCFVLIGYPKDTFEKAELRLNQTLDLGLTPMAMLYRESDEERDPDWSKLQRDWVRLQIIHGSQSNENLNDQLSLIGTTRF